MSSKRKLSAGFTLIELMVTVAIVGLLATMATPLAEIAVRRSRETELRSALRQIRTALDDYKRAADSGQVERAADASGYPASLETLVQGVVNAKDPAKPRLFFLRRIPADPMFNGPPDTPPAQTWLLRSYASGPEQPAPGKDVFDVSSNAPGSGLNGRPYREW